MKKQEMISQKIAYLADRHLSAMQPCQKESIIDYIQEQIVVRFPIHGNVYEVIDHVDEDEVKRVLGRMVLQGLIIDEDGGYWNLYLNGKSVYQQLGFAKEQVQL